MIANLGELIDDFPGAANQTRCFLHILNLVVKSILQQFDLPKKKKASDNDLDEETDETLDQAAEELLRLAGDVDNEGNMMENEEEEDDNDEGWIDEREEMTEDELKDLSASVAPVRLLLTKVRLHIIIINY
jgi:hypothetical protein